jgi:hypothetical protein
VRPGLATLQRAARVQIPGFSELDHDQQDEVRDKFDILINGEKKMAKSKKKPAKKKAAAKSPTKTSPAPKKKIAKAPAKTIAKKAPKKKKVAKKEALLVD